MNNHNGHNGFEPGARSTPPPRSPIGGDIAPPSTGLIEGATIARVILLAAVGVVLYLAREILAPFIVAAAFAYIFSPVVGEIQERTHLRRIAVVALFYVVILAGLAAGIWLVEARLVRELRILDARGPDLFDTAVTQLMGADSFTFLGQQVDAHSVTTWINGQVANVLAAPSDTLHVAERAFDWIGKTLLALLALFYLLLDGRNVGGYLLHFIPYQHRASVQELGAHVHWVLGRYLRGQLYLIGIMSVVTYLVLTFGFHLRFAVLIAVLTGVLEVIPLLGPVLAASIASVIALTQGGPGMMIAIIVTYTVLRQLEDQLVMPIVVGRAVHLHPLITIFAVLTGATTAGVLGAVLAVPIAAAIRVTIDYVFVDPKQRAPNADEKVKLGDVPVPEVVIPPTAD
ncbi:MAG: hypothetical protein QOF51_1885 [Chloroflexota bacterium]|jgi:predicted PurR-regulated permease PerM|nr:hypothetical protein [Chloroflexota bacterium]